MSHHQTDVKPSHNKLLSAALVCTGFAIGYAALGVVRKPHESSSNTATKWKSPASKEKEIELADSRDQSSGPGREPLTAIDSAPTSEPNGSEGPVQSRGRLVGEVIYEAAIRAGDPHAYGRVVGLYDEMDEDTTEYFVAKYTDALKKGAVDELAMKLACFSGGRPLSDLITERLKSPTTSNEELETIKLAIGGVLPKGYRITSMPLNSDLRQFMTTLSTSSEPIDRVASVGLMGHESTDESRARIMSALKEDSDIRVRTAALWALTNCGTPTELQMLKVWSRQYRMSRDDAYGIGKELASAIIALQRRLRVK